MTLTAKTLRNFQHEGETNVMEHPASRQQKDEMTLCVNQVITHKNAADTDRKQSLGSDVDSLEELFHQFVREEGLNGSVKIKRNASQELEIDGMSHMTLHSFLLKAEELGKNITYTKSFKVTISG